MRNSTEEWEEKGRFANLIILGCGNKRRLVDRKGRLIFGIYYGLIFRMIYFRDKWFYIN